MNLSAFNDVDPQDEGSMREFLDANALAHETIYNTLLGVNGVVINHYPLWAPDGPDDDWLQIHDAEHKAIAVALGFGTPPDLDAVDFESAGAAQDWFNNHALQHSLIAITMNI